MSATAIIIVASLALVALGATIILWLRDRSRAEDAERDLNQRMAENAERQRAEVDALFRAIKARDDVRRAHESGNDPRLRDDGHRRD